MATEVQEAPAAEVMPSSEDIAAVLAEPTEPAELVGLTPEEKIVAAKILPRLLEKAKVAVNARYVQDLEKLTTELKASNTQMIQAELEKIREASKPPDKDAIAKLISQEYAELEIKLRERTGTRKSRTFVLYELPQSIEQQFFDTLRKAIVPRLKDLQSMDWKAGTVGEKLRAVLDALPDTFTMLASLCAMCLNPFPEEDNENKDIDMKWVQNNMNSDRIIHVIEAQIAVSRMRDFFSAVSRVIPVQPTL